VHLELIIALVALDVVLDGEGGPGHARAKLLRVGRRRIGRWRPFSIAYTRSGSSADIAPSRP